MIPVKVEYPVYGGKVVARRCSNNVQIHVSIEQLQVPEGYNAKALETLYG